MNLLIHFNQIINIIEMIRLFSQKKIANFQ
jgi:hypothetical protein